MPPASRTGNPPAYGPKAGGPALSGLLFAGNSNARNQNLVGGANYIFSPTMLADFRVGYSRYRVDVLPLDYGSDTDQAAGLRGLNLPNRPDTSGISAFTIPGSGGFNFGYSVGINQCNCLLHDRYQMFQAVNNWTKIVGNHSVKWGVDVRRTQNNRVPSDNRRNGSFAFSPSITGTSTVPNSGLAISGFLLGLPSGFTRFAEQTTDPEDLQWSMNYFVQDSWRVTSKLTVNFGVRWDTWFPDGSLHGGQGSRNYVNRHGAEIPRHVMAMESDLGAFQVLGVASRVPLDRLPVARAMVSLLAPWGAQFLGNEAGGGSDVGPLGELGVPLLDVRTDAAPYFDLHHTANDTFDKVDPALLRQNVAAYATLAYLAAQYPGDFGRAPKPKRAR